MKHFVLFSLIATVSHLSGQPLHPQRAEAEYYVALYAHYYRVPVSLVRAIVQQESGWNPCVVSYKGAVGLMQLMPETAKGLGVHDRCNIRENIAGGVHYLAWLLRKFHGEVRLAVAAYYAGEHAIQERGLKCRNPDVVAYVHQVRSIYSQLTASKGAR